MQSQPLFPGSSIQDPGSAGFQSAVRNGCVMDRVGTVGIVGVGLIGATIGLALRQRAVAGQVVGVDIDAQAIAAAREIGALDAGGSDLDALRPADLVVVAVPPDDVVSTAGEAAAGVEGGGLLTDGATPKGGYRGAVVGGVAG